jgi:hypothetical protein
MFRIFEKRALRRIFGPKREEVAGGWRRLHNEGLHNLYSSPNVKEDEMGRACSPHGRDEKCRQNFGRKPERKRPLGRPRRKWKANIRMDIR